jgi:C1A family cysteine protease
MDYRIGVYRRLTSNQARRVHLAKEGPFVVGVPVFSNWSTIGPDGVVPEPGGVLDGGHALLVVGYDDTTELFKFQNSWGTSWGKRGYGFFSYDYMKNHSWSSWGAMRL